MSRAVTPDQLAIVDKLHCAATAAPSTVGARQRPVWTAFAAGLAAPAMVYDPPPAYTGLIRYFSVRSSFVQVGAWLSQSARGSLKDGQSPKLPSGDEPFP